MNRSSLLLMLRHQPERLTKNKMTRMIWMFNLADLTKRILRKPKNPKNPRKRMTIATMSKLRVVMMMMTSN